MQVHTRGSGAGQALLASLLPVTLAALGPPAVAAQSCPAWDSIAAGVQPPLAYVRYLADDALEGRLAGTPAERCAGDFIAARFRQLGLQPAGTDGGWFQIAPLASVALQRAPGSGTQTDPHSSQHTSQHGAAVTGRNVVAVLPGSDPVLREEYVIIGAHYDHIGRGELGSTTPARRGEIHNGADDNASGVAALLHAAQLLAEGPRPARSVLFLAFTGEEEGLLGSAHFARQPTIALDRAVGMINMDMVGRLESGGLVVNGFDTATEWRELLEKLGSAAGIRLQFARGGYGASDHTSFYLADIPVLHFFTNTHGQYHNPDDDWNLIDADGLARIGTLAADVARSVADRREQLTLVRTPPPAPRSGRSGSGAWLGTVPDFSPVERGVLLGGVTAGSPAEKAGMRRGDILIRMGEHEIADLPAMFDVLSKLRPGDRVQVVVLRGGTEHKLEAVLSTRSR